MNPGGNFETSNTGIWGIMDPLLRRHIRHGASESVRLVEIPLINPLISIHRSIEMDTRPKCL